MDERLIAIGLARPADAPVAAPPPAAAAHPAAAPIAKPVIDERLIALGLAPPVVARVAAPPAAPPFAKPVIDEPPVELRVARPVEAPLAASVAAPVAAPLPIPVAPWLQPRVAPPAPIARPAVAVRQSVRLRDGRRDRDAVCEVDATGLRIIGTQAERFIAWPDLRSISVHGDRVEIVSPSGPIDLAVALDGVSEPDLAPLFARVLEEGRGGTLNPTGAMHELTLGIDRTVEGFADADDPIVPVVVGAFAAVAAIMLGAAIPMVVVLFAHVQSAQPGTFAILPRVASFDPRVIVASFASAIALAGAVGRLALGPSAAVWARGTMRGWHRNAEGFEAAARRMGAWLMLRPRLAAVVAGVAFVTLVPGVFARTTLDTQGIHESSGVPFISRDRSWAELADVTSLQVGLGERAEGFDVQLVLSDGSTVSTRGRDLVGGTERALYDFARKQAR